MALLDHTAHTRGHETVHSHKATHIVPTGARTHRAVYAQVYARIAQIYAQVYAHTVQMYCSSSTTVRTGFKQPL